jgi:dTDP-glucose 4,6-dehydratase
MKNKKGIFISGESGVIPLAIQKLIESHRDYYIVNDQKNDVFNLKQFKQHQSFLIREKELDFTDKDLLNSEQLKLMWENTSIIIHSGAFVGTDYCLSKPQDSIKVNVEGTYNLVEIAKKYDIKFVYFSTTAIFDPNDYSFNKQITENTKVNPKTLYGITKFAGEQIVDRLFENKKSMIIRPVFGFSNYPDDLHSALTKFIYVTYQNEFLGNNLQLDILLDPLIGKNYTRVENIAQSVIQLIENEAWGEKINVGDHWSERKDWFTMSKIIFPEIKTSINRYVHFFSDKDYLHFHNIENAKMNELAGKIRNYISFEQGVKEVVNSVKVNQSIKPYWI